VRRGWQLPPAAATSFYARLFDLADEAISAGRYCAYAVPTGADGLSWRATAVSAGGLIIPLQWHGMWCPWTHCFSASYRADQPDALNRRDAMWSLLDTMTFGLSARRGLKRVPAPDDCVRVRNRHGEECRTLIAFADLGVWGEQGGYFGRRQIQ